MNPKELQRLPSDCTADDITEVNERDGGVIVDGWLSPGLLQQLNTELEPWLARHQGTDSGSAASDSFLGKKTRRLQGLTVKAPTFVKIMIDDRIMGFAERVLAPIGPSIILNNGEIIDIGPGESAQPMHRDDDAWNFANAADPLMINTIAALVDITPDMGATLVVPGSHRWEPNRLATEDEIVSCDLPAGSTLFFRGDTLHAGGANRSTKRRRALSTGICCGWLRPVENSYTTLPIEVVNCLPRRAQALLGYALYDASKVGGGYLGYHDMGDPMKLFT
ncbi:MAG TPA: phytanoyl-CoA dioxygenase family protein [Gammaproteobacteria bacterium]|nr:phytanoyl-CoA dioxygenase family protein [Gammaproteobacteria bacterium]